LFYVVAADWLGFFITAALITLATSMALGARWKLALPLAVRGPVQVLVVSAPLKRPAAVWGPV
jgi:putative tricarboxylic transport membrane protein